MCRIGYHLLKTQVIDLFASSHSSYWLSFLWGVYQFLKAGLTQYHKLDVLKQYELILLHFCKQEALNQGDVRVTVPPMALRKNPSLPCSNSDDPIYSLVCKQNSNLCLLLHMAFFSVCFTVFFPGLKPTSTTSSVCDLEHGTECKHLGLSRGVNMIIYIYFVLWHIAGTQPVFNKYFFETAILFGKAFPMMGLSLYLRNKFMSTSNHYKREWDI